MISEKDIETRMNSLNQFHASASMHLKSFKESDLPNREFLMAYYSGEIWALKLAISHLSDLIHPNNSEA